jgi:malate permease and related proteins
VILPVFIVFAIGFIGQKTIGFEPRTLSKMALYLMSPFLAFRTFYEHKVNEQYLYLSIYAVGICFSLIAVIYLLSYIRKFSVQDTCGLILSSVFMNTGNYGTPVALLAFGKTGLNIAIILLVIVQLIMSTVGIYYAAKGSNGLSSYKIAVQAVVKMPIVYGAFLGVLFQFTHVTIPRFLYTAVDLVADAVIPTIMIVLGIQLAAISLKNIEKEKMIYALIIKLIISPLLALVFVMLLPVEEIVGKIMILMAAMPSAANTTMYALQFNTQPEFVSSVTFVSTIISIVYIPLVLYFIQNL